VFTQAHTLTPCRAVSALLVFSCYGCFSSTDAGSPGAGGSSAAGGSSVSTSDGSTMPVDTANQELIDDMEDGDGSILAKNGRVGAWYTYNDASMAGMQTPAPMVPYTMTAGGEGGSAFASESKGSGFAIWGAGFGFNLHDPGDGANGSAKTIYDGSAYKGIAFWAKAGAGSTQALRVNISDKDTDPAGGVCMPAEKCNDHFGTDIHLTTDWAMYTVTFADIAQLGWGQSVAAFDPAHLYAVQFQVGKSTMFDVWLDNVAFLEK
jgi:hypothetical protein